MLKSSPSSPRRNPNLLNGLHTLQNTPLPTHSKSATCTLFTKHRGVYPPPFHFGTPHENLTQHPYRIGHPLLTLTPPAATPLLRIQLRLREFPPLAPQGPVTR